MQGEPFDFCARNPGEWLKNAESRRFFAQTVLPGYLPTCRWYRSKASKILAVTVAAWARVGENGALCVLRVDLENGDSGLYALPLALVSDPISEPPPEPAVLLRGNRPAGPALLCDGCHDSDFRAALFSLILGKATLPLGEGMLLGHPSAAWNPPSATQAGLDSRVLATEQSNTAMIFASGHFLKLYRRLEAGLHPEPEILRFLREQTDFRGVPEFQSVLHWERPGKAPTTVALLQPFLASEGNAWEYALGRVFDPAFDAWVESLGRRTAEMHRALGSRPDDARFAPEELLPADLKSFADGASKRWEACAARLSPSPSSLNPDDAALAASLLAQSGAVESALRRAAPGSLGKKIRGHGDFHLGQTLCAGSETWFLDFEGEISRPLAERRAKHSPLRDVAGMLRSFHYALHAAARQGGGEIHAARVEARHGALSSRYLAAYFAGLEGARLLPPAPETRAALLRFFVLEKAVYELDYELNNRPAWIGIPLQGLLSILTG